MRLFHVSEDVNITIFEPRLPKRTDLDQNICLVWAICERALPNFLTPRNCPRVTYHIGENTTNEDIAKYMPHGYKHVVIIENEWLEYMKSTVLYLYEFNNEHFYLQDYIAGYYVSEKAQIPINKHILTNLEKELERRKTKLYTVDNLWEICDEIKNTSFNWSMCRMAFAKERL